MENDVLEFADIKLSELEHHGIPGQKHGERRAGWYPISAWKEHLANMGRKIPKDLEDVGGSSGSGGGSSGSNESSGKSQKKVPKNSKRMSDEELRNAVNRLQMEDNYQRLTKTGKYKEQSAASKLLKEAASNLGRQVLNKGVDALVKTVFDKKFDSSEYDFGDVSKVPLSKLQEANKWFAAKDLYEKNQKASKESVKKQSDTSKVEKKLPKFFDDNEVQRFWDIDDKKK